MITSTVVYSMIDLNFFASAMQKSGMNISHMFSRLGHIFEQFLLN